MKVIDTERSWMDGAKVYPRNVPFEADKRLMNLISAQSETFFEVPNETGPKEDSGGRGRELDDVDPLADDIEPNAAEAGGDSEPDAEPLTAEYKGGGWYYLSDGSTTRRKDIPPGTKII